MKCDKLVDDLGFDAAVNYKDANFRDNLKAATPDGVDVYFDNTGGSILGSALFRLNEGGRIACCGFLISCANFRAKLPHASCRSLIISFSC